MTYIAESRGSGPARPRSRDVRLLERRRLLGQAEIQQLNPLLSYENVRGFQIPMSDASLVGRIQSVQNLSGVLNSFFERQWSF